MEGPNVGDSVLESTEGEYILRGLSEWNERYKKARGVKTKNPDRERESHASWRLEGDSVRIEVGE